MSLSDVVGNWPLLIGGAVAGIGGIFAIWSFYKKAQSDAAGKITADAYIKGKSDSDKAEKEIADVAKLAQENPSPDLSRW